MNFCKTKGYSECAKPTPPFDLYYKIVHFQRTHVLTLSLLNNKVLCTSIGWAAFCCQGGVMGSMGNFKNTCKVLFLLVKFINVSQISEILEVA